MKPVAREEEEETHETCIICTEQITFYAFGECNHKVCHICALRLRALYKNNTCAYCKSEMPHLIFTNKPERQFQDYDFGTMQYKDEALQVFMETFEIHEDTMRLLRFNCPHLECDFVAQSGWKELKEHVRKEHRAQMCGVCVKNKKLFAHEHRIFTRKQLDVHYKKGDPDDPSFKGHPQCGFCQTAFYDKDALFVHCREKHEVCFICERQGQRHEYFVNYEELEKHFKEKHFLCQYRDCLEKKFVVFGTSIDLKAHEAEVHAPAKNRRGIPILDLDFSYGHPLGNGTSNGSSSLGRTRGRSARQETSTRVPAVTPVVPQQQQQTVVVPQETTTNQNDEFPALGHLHVPSSFGTQLSSSQTSVKAEQLSPAVAPGDPEMVAQLRKLFKGDTSKLNEFRSLTSSFKSQLIVAQEFLDAFLSLIEETIDDARIVQVGKVWNKLVATFPDVTSGEKIKSEMKRVWNDYKIKEESDRPSSSKKGAVPWMANAPKGKVISLASSSLAGKNKRNNRIVNAHRLGDDLYERIASEVLSKKEDEPPFGEEEKEEEEEEQSQKQHERQQSRKTRQKFGQLDEKEEEDIRYTAAASTSGGQPLHERVASVAAAVRMGKAAQQLSENDFPSLAPSTAPKQATIPIRWGKTAAAPAPIDPLTAALAEIYAEDHEGDSSKKKKGKKVLLKWG